MFLMVVLGECMCEIEEEDWNKSLLCKYKLVVIVLIFVVSVVGVCFFVLSKKMLVLSLESNFFFIMKVFVVGVILLMGFMFVFFDVFENLMFLCISEYLWGDFLFMGFVVMVFVIGIFMVDLYVMVYYSKELNGKVYMVSGDKEGVIFVYIYGLLLMEFYFGEMEFFCYCVIS